MAETIGSRLRAARESKGMSIEDVAFETRIRSSYLKCLEANDYSQFASTTYAKSFLTLYSRFLEVEVDEAMHYFNGRDEIHLAGPSSYLAAVQPIESVTAPMVTRTHETDEDGTTVVVERERPGIAPVFLGVIVVLLISAIPLLWFLGREADSIDDVTTKAKELVENANQAVSAVGNADATNTSPPEDHSVNPDRPRLALESREVAASWLIEDSRPEPPAPVNGSDDGSVVASAPTSATETPESTLDQATPSSPSPSEQSVTTTTASPSDRPRFGSPPKPTALPSSFPADLPPKPLPADAPPGVLAVRAGTLKPLPGNRAIEETTEPSPASTTPARPLIAQETVSPLEITPETSSDRKPEPGTKKEPEENPGPGPEPAPQSTPATRGPIRAVPLVAQPVVLPEVDARSEEEEEEETPDSDADAVGN